MLHLFGLDEFRIRNEKLLFAAGHQRGDGFALPDDDDDVGSALGPTRADSQTSLIPSDYF